MIRRIRAYFAFRRLAAAWFWDKKSESWANPKTGSVIYRYEHCVVLVERGVNLPPILRDFRQAVEHEARDQ